MARPGWATTASSGTSRAAISDWNSARYSCGPTMPPASASAASASISASAAAPAPFAHSPWAPPPGPAASASATARWRATCSASGARPAPASGSSAALSQASQPGAPSPTSAAKRPSSSQRTHGGPPRSSFSSKRSTQPQVRPARRARDQRMLEQREQRLRGQRRARKRRDQPQQDPRRRQRQRPPGAVVGDQPPAVEFGGDAAGQRPVRSDERRAGAVLGRLAHQERDRQRLALLVGSLDPGQALGGGGERRPQRAALGPPLVGDRRRPQRQRDQRVACRVRRHGRVPGRHRAGIEAERRGEPTEAVLRMVGGPRFALGQPVPDRRRQPRVEPGQHQRPLRQPRHRGHEGAGRSPRAGGAGDDHRPRRRRHRPERGERLGGGPHPRLGARRPGRGGIVGDQRQEAQAALPVRGVLAGIDRGEGVERAALALHLVEQLGEAVGEVEGRRFRGTLALGHGPRRDQPRELELAAQRRHRRRQAGGRVVGELGDDADPRQQPRPPGGEGRGERPLRPAGVDPDLDPPRRLRRLAGEPGVEPGDQRRSEVDSGRQAEDPRPRGRREQRHRASSASARAMPSGRPTSTQPPACTMPRSRPSARSRSQTAFSEKARSGKASSVPVSSTPAPA